MFTRFQRNVRLYPRTFTVLLVLAVIDAVVEVEFFHTPLVAEIIVAFIAGMIYAWFVTSADRVSLLLQLLDNFEGRDTETAQDKLIRMTNEYCATCNAQYKENGECDLSAEECAVEHGLISDERGQDVAEYAVMLAVILAIAIGTIHLIGSSANNVFSQIGSKIQ